MWVWMVVVDVTGRDGCIALDFIACMVRGRCWMS